MEFVKERENEKLLMNYFVFTDLIKIDSHKARGQ